MLKCKSDDRDSLALGAVAVTAGLVAALLRPVWIGIIAFALSGLTMLLGWQVTVGSGVLVLVYFSLHPVMP